MEKTEQLKREIAEMNELVARIRLSLHELEQAYHRSLEELSKFQELRKACA